MLNRGSGHRSEAFGFDIPAVPSNNRSREVPVIRAVSILIAAISLSRPSIPKEEAGRYAKILNEIGKTNEIDPLIAVAMVHYESHWQPGVVSSDGEDHGLGQVRARYVGACLNDEDPVNNPSEACKAVKANLLVGETNLKAMGGIIKANKKMCLEKKHSSKNEHWIAGYQGLSEPEKGKYCTPGPTTTRVLDYYNDLLEKFAGKPKQAPTKPDAKAKTATKPAKAAATKPAATKPSSPQKPAPQKAGPQKAGPQKAAPQKPSPQKAPQKPAAKPAKKPIAKAPAKPAPRKR